MLPLVFLSQRLSLSWLWQKKHTRGHGRTGPDADRHWDFDEDGWLRWDPAVARWPELPKGSQAESLVADSMLRARERMIEQWPRLKRNLEKVVWDKQNAKEGYLEGMMHEPDQEVLSCLADKIVAR